MISYSNRRPKNLGFGNLQNSRPGRVQQAFGSPRRGPSQAKIVIFGTYGHHQVAG
jgi:hypothetical protein